MSKNLRGFASGSSIKIDLLDIDANSVTATTGTFTDIIATNYSINSVAINNLIVTGIVRLTGIVDAPVTSPPEYEILFKDPSTNLVYKFSTLVFNTSSGTLKSPNILVTGNLTVMGSMPSLEVTGQTELGTGLSIQSLTQVNSGLNIAYGITLWNSTTRDLSHDITKLYYNKANETLYAPNISVTNFNIVPVTRSDDVEYPVVFFDDNTDNLAIDSISSNIKYNPSTNRLTLRECKVDGEAICDVLIITKEIITGTDSQVKIFIEDGFNFKIEDTTNIEGFYFFSGVTEWMRIAVGETRIATDVEIAGDTTLENSLTVETGTFLGSSLHVDALDPVVSDVSYAVLLWDITSGAGNRSVTYDFTNFYYDTTSDTLFVPNISANIPNLQIVAISKNDSIDYPVTFHDTTLNKVCKDSVSDAFRYNPSTNKLSVYRINCEFNLEVLNKTFLGSTVYVNTLNPVATNTTYPLLVWDNTGALDDRAISHDTTKLYYDTTSDTLYTPNISLTDATMTGDFICNGTATFGDECTITSSKNLKFVEASATVVGDKGIIYSQDIGRVIFRRSSTLDPVVQFVNEDARINGISGLYQIQLSATDVDINTVSTGTIRNRVDGTIKTTLNNTGFTVSTDLEVTQDITINGATSICSKDVTSTNQLCRLLFLDGSSDVGTNYDIVRATPLYYIPSSQMLVSGAVRGQVQLISPQLTLLGSGLSSTNAIIGLYDDGIAVRNRYGHVGGHVFTDGSNNLLSTNTTQTRIYNELQCDDVLTLNSVPIVPTTSNTDILLLDSSNNQISKSGLTFNASGGVLSTTNISLSGALSTLSVTTSGDVTVGGDLDVTGNIDVTNNLTVSGTFTCGDIDFGNLDSTSAAAKISVQQPLQYGSGIFVQPLNYTIRIGTTDLIRTIDTVSGTGFNSGKYGNGVTLSILRSGVKTTSYGQDSTLITWNPYIDATNTATNFTLGGLPGLWDIKMTCKYMSSSLGASNRVNPIVRAVLNNTTTIDGGDQSSYIRHQTGRVGGIVWHNKIYLNTNDSIRFDTYVNFSGAIGYASVISSTDFDLSDFMFIATFLGPLDEYDKTPA